jgi:hypothetical protein
VNRSGLYEVEPCRAASGQKREVAAAAIDARALPGQSRSRPGQHKRAARLDHSAPRAAHRATDASLRDRSTRSGDGRRLYPAAGGRYCPRLICWSSIASTRVSTARTQSSTRLAKAWLERSSPRSPAAVLYSRCSRYACTAKPTLFCSTWRCGQVPRMWSAGTGLLPWRKTDSNHRSLSG